MVIDWLLAPILDAMNAAVGSLPTGQPLSLPAIDVLWSQLRGLDSLIPVMGPITVMLGVLAAGVVFVAVRLVLTVWHLIYP